MIWRPFACLSSALFFLTMGLYWGDNIFYWLFAVIMALMALSLISLLGLAFGLEYRQTLDQAAVTRGETVRLRLAIKNKSPFFYPRVELSVITNNTKFEGRPQEHTLSLPPMREREITVDLPCDYRGVYSVGVHSCRVFDSFGLFYITLRRVSRCPRLRLAVWPQTGAAALPRLSTRNDAPADRARAGQQTGEQVRDIRGFRPGDSPRRMHWKASARTRKWMIREFDATTHPRYLLMLDTTAAVPGEPELRRAAQIESLACDCAFSLAQEALLQNAAASLRTPRQGGLDVSRPADLAAIRRLLCEIPFNCEPNAAAARLSELLARQTRRGDTVCLIAHSVPPPLETALCQTARLELPVHLFWVMPEPGHTEQLNRLQNARVTVRILEAEHGA